MVYRLAWLMVSLVWAAEAAAQPALERLERQLQNAPAQTPQPAREAGYLGLITRNDTTGGFIRVVQVVPDSPGAAAGVRTDDIVLSVEGRLTRDMNDLAAALQGRAPGERISLAILRGQEEQTLGITLGRRPQTGDGPMLFAPQPGGATPQTTQRAPLPAPETAAPAQPLPRSDANRLDLLERRMAELERRLAELERLLTRRP